jgi:hypothetical protein
VRKRDESKNKMSSVSGRMNETRMNTKSEIRQELQIDSVSEKIFTKRDGHNIK